PQEWTLARSAPSSRAVMHAGAPAKLSLHHTKRKNPENPPGDRTAAQTRGDPAVERSCNHRLERWAAQRSHALEVDADCREVVVCDSGAKTFAAGFCSLGKITGVRVHFSTQRVAVVALRKKGKVYFLDIVARGLAKTLTGTEPCR